MSNPIIIYVSLIYSNRNIFFEQVHLTSAFISWLNLDIGFDLCFFEGMDIYTKTWLDLAHIIFLVIVIIRISSHSSRFSNLIGKRNPVATLATLILISYTKFLHTIIICFSYVTPQGNTISTAKRLASSTLNGSTSFLLVWRSSFLS